MDPEYSVSMLRRTHHSPLSWAISIYSSLSHLILWRSILILFYYLHLGLPRNVFPRGYPTKALYALLFSPTCTTSLRRLDMLTRIMSSDK